MLPSCPSRARTEKWTVRSIMHFIDLAIVNSWLEMRAFKKGKGVPARDIPQFRTFKLKFGENLVHQNSKAENDISTDSDEDEEVIGFDDGRRKPLPGLVRWTRNARHLPTVHDGAQQRCRQPKSKFKSTMFCTTCKVFLCLKKTNNGFFQFHQK